MPHRVIGWIWAVLMAGVALSTFWITRATGLGHYSWVRGIAAYVLVAVLAA